MMRARAAPLAAVAAGGALLYYQTKGGAKEPRSRTATSPENQSPVGETMAAIAGTGGKNTTKNGPESNVADPKDTHIASKSTDVTTKRNPQKSRDDI